MPGLPRRPIWGSQSPSPMGALLLLLAINMLNYIDRYVLAAVEKPIADTFFHGQTEGVLAKMGLLPMAFLVSYFATAPLFGWMADRMSRWLLVGGAVIVWSLASGGSGLALGFGMLVITRMFVGIGEAGYGPAAPTIIADLYPIEKRGRVLAWFYMAIPVGSALGYILGGVVNKHMSWRWAFLLVVPPGILLGLWAMLMKDPRRGGRSERQTTPQHSRRDYRVLLRTPSYVLNTVGMTALTFAIGGIAYFMPRYLLLRHGGQHLSEDESKQLLERLNVVFGLMMAAAGVTATLLGGFVGDWARTRIRGGYFVVSAIGILCATPLIALVPIVPFPAAWVIIFLALFALFFNTGPANTVLANVAHPSIRATAFALNIFIIHLLGDAISPTILGLVVGDLASPRWTLAMFAVAGVTALAGVFWFWGSIYLDRDTARASGEGGDTGAAEGSASTQP